MSIIDSTDIDIEEEVCYICLENTNNQSDCKCESYVCKKCLKKEKSYRTECSICKKEFETNINTIDKNQYPCITKIIECGMIIFYVKIQYFLVKHIDSYTYTRENFIR